MREILLVALGGALGALTRMGVSQLAVRWLGQGFPWGTLLVNVVGCFVIGIIGQSLVSLESVTGKALTVESQSLVSLLRYGLVVGFLGALTTFSTFGFEVIRDFSQPGRAHLALLNIGGNLGLCLLAVWLGMWLAAGKSP